MYAAKYNDIEPILTNGEEAVYYMFLNKQK